MSRRGRARRARFCSYPCHPAREFGESAPTVRRLCQDALARRAGRRPGQGGPNARDAHAGDAIAGKAHAGDAHAGDVRPLRRTSAWMPGCSGTSRGQLGVVFAGDVRVHAGTSWRGWPRHKGRPRRLALVLCPESRLDRRPEERHFSLGGSCPIANVLVHDFFC